MRATAWLLLVAMVAVPFTGCLGGDDGATTAATDDNDSTNTTFDAPQGRGPIVAFEETNETEAGEGGVDHHHDNWKGASRITIFESQVAMEPFPGGGTYVDFRPKLFGEANLVYEGTSTVELTISAPKRHACEPLITFGTHYLCTDYPVYVPMGVPPVDDPTGGPAGLKLSYKHASTIEWIDAGDIVWNQPSAIQITHPTQTDMPHATTSAWEFRIASPNDADTTLMFTVKVDIVRGEGEIPYWPGHPLLYTAERPSRVVVDDVQAYACDSGFTATGCATVGGDTAEIVPDKLISYGTRTLFIWVNITDYQQTNPAFAPNSWFLYHSNTSGGQNATRTVDAENYPIEQREFFWALPVDEGAMDSPYADGSKWRFSLGASYVPPDNPLVGSCYGGCAEWAAAYTIKVIASMVQLPASEYHMACLDTQVTCPTDEASGEGDQRYDGRAYTAADLEAMGVRALRAL